MDYLHQVVTNHFFRVESSKFKSFCMKEFTISLWSSIQKHKIGNALFTDYNLT